jgi:RNA polymerase sigma factor (sigma-70 family)
MAVDAMRRGALDFIRKPFREQDLLERINEALDLESGRREKKLDGQRLQHRVASLTEREREVFELVADGEMNKAIAQDLGISERTVELHRSQVMKKLGARTLAQLVRIRIELEQLRKSL